MKPAERARVIAKVRADLDAGREPTMDELGNALIAAGIANPPDKVAFLKALHVRKWAAKILGDLPCEPDEVTRTLQLAMRMHREFVLGEPAGRPKKDGAR